RGQRPFARRVHHAGVGDPDVPEVVGRNAHRVPDAVAAADRVAHDRALAIELDHGPGLARARAVARLVVDRDPAVTARVERDVERLAAEAAHVPHPARIAVRDDRDALTAA